MKQKITKTGESSIIIQYPWWLGWIFYFINIIYLSNIEKYKIQTSIDKYRQNPHHQTSILARMYADLGPNKPVKPKVSIRDLK